MKNLLTVLLLLTLATAANAQKCSTHQRKLKNPLTWMKSNMCADDYAKWLQTHEPKPWYGSRQWWAGELMMAGGIAADTYTTANRCHGCYEQNSWLIGSQPTTGALVGVSTANFAVQTTLHIWSYNLGKRDPSKTWRAISLWAQPVAVGTIGGFLANRNTNLGSWQPK